MGRKKKMVEQPNIIKKQPIIVSCDGVNDLQEELILSDIPESAASKKTIKCFQLFGKEFDIIDSLDNIGYYFNEHNFVDGLTLNIKTIEVDEEFLEKYKKEHGY